MDELQNFDISKTAVLGGGGVEYAAEEAAASIQDVIDALEQAKEDGMEFVLMASGNYRGASWASIRPDWSYADDDM